MLYTPIHFAVFLIISALLPVLLYTAYTLHGLYLALGEAYIDVSIVTICHEMLAHLVMKSCCIALQFVLSRGRERDSFYYDHEEEPLDFRRISV